MILVIGGRSEIGSALIDLVLRQGGEVRALFRGPDDRPAGEFAQSSPFRDHSVRYP